MYQAVLTSRTSPVITPQQLAVFGHFDCPEQYVPNSSPQTQTIEFTMLETFIEAATDQIETMAQYAGLTEQLVLTLDFFPNTQDPRNFLQYELSYAFAITPWWWWGFPTKDSIELVRRPVQVPAYTGSADAVTGVSVANNVVTVTTALNPGVGKVVILNGTAEGNVNNPQTTPSTTPFLNGVPLTVLTSNSTQFTASFPNFYQLGSSGQLVPQSYTNNSDTGTAQVWSSPLIVTFNDANGVLQIWNTMNYTVQYNKVCLTVGNWWPLTDRRQDCIQITYWAGNTSTPANVDARFQMGVMFLANHFVENRSVIAIEPTSEIAQTLNAIIGSKKTFRIPR
jgi:hypothetical protein